MAITQLAVERRSHILDCHFGSLRPQSRSNVTTRTVGTAEGQGGEVDIRAVKILRAEKGNRNAVSDAGVAALLVTTTARAAALNVKINLGGLSGDDATRIAGDLEATLGPVLAEAAVLADLVEDAL